MLPSSQKLPTLSEIHNELRRRRCSAGLLDFILETLPGYEVSEFHRLICRALEQFYQDVVDRKSPRLMVFAPPRHGKSEIVSRRFPAWAFGKNPDLSIISTSYSADLSSRLNRDVQRIIDDPLYGNIFPKTSLFGKNIRTVANGAYMRNSDVFEIVNHRGVYRSAGVGAGITGMGAEILIIDDPIKDASEAYSETIRKSIAEWYYSTAYTRLAPGGGILLIMTRWHFDDLAGRLIEQEKTGGEKWQVLRYPAICEVEEPFRKPGDPLDSNRYPISALLKIKGAVGSRVWTSLYQQHPSAEEGTEFKREWWENKFYETAPECPIQIISVDAAFKDESTSDFVVIQAWGASQKDFYLLDQVRGQYGFVNSLAAIRTMKARYPRANLLIEDKANGTAIIEVLRKEFPGILAVTPIGGKVSRARAVAPLVEAGNVYVPKFAPWIGDFIEECCSFPFGRYDDQVDAMTQALNKMGTTGPQLFFFGADEEKSA